MRTPYRTIVPIAGLALVFACGGDDAADDPAAADTVAVEEADDEGASTGLSPSTATVSQLTVSNPMPHAMIVTVAYEGGGETELGSVPANGEQSFTVSASPGETVTLTARDEADTHSVDSSVQLEGQNAWTIE